LRFVPNIILKLFTQDEYVKQLQNILGFKPSRLVLYEIAFSHSSLVEEEINKDNNERLEYLGDAILGAIVSDYLYKKYPRSAEGFLTEMRSKIVNRVTLNSIAIKLGLKEFLKYNKQDNFLRTSQIFGNALEALVGAIYIDKGFATTKKFVINKIVNLHVDLEELEGEESNLKNKLIGWANRNKKQIEFKDIREQLDGKKKIFTVAVFIDHTSICEASATNKKEASKRAAKIALEQLAIDE
jgi:ribonuclease III